MKKAASIMVLSVSKRAARYFLLCLGALICQIFITWAVVPLGLKLGSAALTLTLLALGTTGGAVALAIGVLGGLWLRERPRSAYIMSLFLALFWFACIISATPPKLNFPTFLMFSEIPLTTLIGGFVYAKVNAIKSKWSTNRNGNR
jgi:hypothetical protein